MKPIVGPYSAELYEALAPFAYADEANGWAFLAFVGAVGGMFDEIALLVRDSDDGPGWSALVDPDRAPVWALPWLAQTVGVTLRSGLTYEAQRAAIKAGAATRRGSLAAMVESGRALLTGTQTVDVYERDTSAYHMTIVTYTSQTPYPDATEAAFRTQKPAGVILVYEVRTGQSYQQLLTGHATYQLVLDGYASYQAVRDDVPI